jgi:hypothetical protein
MPRVKFPELLILISILLYAGYATYLGLFLGGRPGGWYEGKFLVLPFYLLAIVGCVVSFVAFVLGLRDVKRARRSDGIAGRRRITIVVTAGLTAFLFALSLPFPVGLGVAYQIAEIRRATWENQ